MQISTDSKRESRGGGKVKRVKWFPVLFLAAAVAVGCGNAAKDMKFSEPGKENNWRTVFVSAVKSGKLSRKESLLLEAAVVRETQHIPPTIAGKTVGQVIEDQKEWLKANPRK
jgi:hypothetical protein